MQGAKLTIDTGPVFHVFQVGTICLPSSDVYQVESKETLLVTLSNFPSALTSVQVGWGLNSTAGAAPDLPKISRLDTLTNAVCTGPTTVYTEDDVTDNMLCGIEQEFSPLGQGNNCTDLGAPLLVYEGGAYSQVRHGHGLGKGRY